MGESRYSTILDHGCRGRWIVSFTPRPGKEHTILIGEENVWAPGPVWTL
jgi:hypothetical protein